MKEVEILGFSEQIGAKIYELKDIYRRVMMAEK